MYGQVPEISKLKAHPCPRTRHPQQCTPLQWLPDSAAPYHIFWGLCCHASSQSGLRQRCPLARTAVIQRHICAGAPQNMYQAPPPQQQQHSMLAPALLGAGAGLLGGVLLGEALEDRGGLGWGGGYGGGYGGGQDVSAQSKSGTSLCS